MKIDNFIDLMLKLFVTFVLMGSLLFIFSFIFSIKLIESISIYLLMISFIPFFIMVAILIYYCIWE